MNWEHRCKMCHKLLAIGEPGCLQVKCAKCGEMNYLVSAGFDVQSAQFADKNGTAATPRAAARRSKT